MKIKLIKFKNVKSTNDIAIKLIKAHKIAPTLITTEKQSKGRGTMGKKWISKKGNLFFSIFFEINLRKISTKQFSILNAYLIKKIINKYILKKITIKWPNDLLINKQKVCGILQELVYQKGKPYLIIGVGINTKSFPEIKNYKTNSLKSFQKKDISNTQILRDIKRTYETFIKEKKKISFIKLKLKYSR